PKIADSVYGSDFGKIVKAFAGMTQYSARPPMLYMYTGFPTKHNFSYLVMMPNPPQINYCKKGGHS
ncbi:MAG: hypothetical protein Q8807_03915, partial ['Waltheria sp.' little leaf phytoplasma]|nr:hypothetical protein ['Waltheria sp.' little leaf phytoplasma]